MTVPAIAPDLRLRHLAAASIRALCVVPEALTVTEWACKYRELPETSTSPGPYDVSVTPYARRPQDLLGDPSVTMVVLCWAAQTTKSTVIENGIGYRIDRMPSPMVVAQPKIDAAEAWAKERFDPMVQTTPRLRALVRTGRSTDSTLRYKRYPGGFLFIASAQSATELASRSAPFVGLDEVDRYQVIPGEGNPVEIALRRQGAADVGVAVLTSTPRDAETTVIWPYLEGGTYELYHVPCPQCGYMQPLRWAGLRWEKGAPETAHYVCGGMQQGEDGTPLGCGAVIEEADKRAMLAAGAWVATNPGATYPSFHLNGLYSPFAKSNWAALAAEWERAQGKPADLQVFVNTRLAELWTETSEQLAADSLLREERLDAYEEGTVPAGVGLLTCGVDAQHNRLEAYVWGWGAGLESWLVATAILPGDPEADRTQPGSVWLALDEFLRRQWPHECGGTMRIRQTFIDSGYATSKVYRYTRARRGWNVYACKGEDGARAIITKPSVVGKERTILYVVGVDTAKNEFLRSQLPEPRRGPGFVHLPTWLTPDQAEQLVAEKRKRKLLRGRVAYEWRPKAEGQPTEALDCRNYARAALEALGTVTIARLGKLAEALMVAESAAPDAKPAETSTPRGVSGAPPQRPAPPRRGGFVNGWRRS